MKYEDLKKRLALETGLSQDVVDAVLDALRETLHEGEAVSLPGVGKFEVVQRAARTGRHPTTGASIAIPAKMAPKFKASSKYREAVEG